MSRTRLAVALAASLATAAFASPAAAKAEHHSRYTYEQTFGSTLRLIKVDLDFEVTEINADWGFLIFEYTSTESGKRKNRASFSFVKDDEDRVVHVSLQIPNMPGYHEQLVMTKLARKLESEHGAPPKPPEPEPDEDEDEDEDPNAPIIPGQDDDDGKKKPRRKPARSPRRVRGR